MATTERKTIDHLAELNDRETAQYLATALANLVASDEIGRDNVLEGAKMYLNHTAMLHESTAPFTALEIRDEALLLVDILIAEVWR